ncbi:MAG: DNA internalization-related competence protein ComEC/Rec2 [Bacillota bacterium]
MRPALYMAAALAAGIAAADWLRPHPALVLVAFCVAVPVLRHRGLALLLGAVALFGALHHAWDQTGGRGSLAAWEGRRVALTGTVVSEPAVRQGGPVKYVVAAEAVEGHRASGRVQVSQRGGRPPGYGERVAVRGRLNRPAGPRTPGGFDEAAFLARQSVYLTLQAGTAERLGPGRLDPLRRAAVTARLRLEGVLERALPPREAALMAGLLFGSRAALDEDIKEAFRAAGVYHLLAVSGGNVALLTGLLFFLLPRLGVARRTASGLAIPVVIFFIFLTGATPSVMRAGLMAVLVLLGDLLRRERDALNTLGVAVALLLACSPSLLFDLGFQLSAGATLGILLFSRPLERWLSPRLEPLFGGWLGSRLAGGLSVTFAAQAVVEPISLHHFGTFSAVAPLANLMVVLLVSWLVPAGLVLVLLGLFLPPSVWLLGRVGGVALLLLIYGVKGAASLPFALVELGRLPALGVVAWYAGLALLAAPSLRRRAVDRTLRVRRGWRAARRGRRLALAGSLAGLLVTALTWHAALAEPPDLLTITFLDVGQGDATLLRAPDGTVMLIDAGQAYEGKAGRPGYDAGAEVVVPYLRRAGVGKLDYLLLTHPDSDHVGGGPAVLRAVPVGALWLTAPEAPERGQAAALQIARERGLPVHLPTEGEVLELGGGVRLELLGPPRRPFEGSRSDDNANCIATRLVYREVAVLLACDLEGEAEQRLVAAGYDLRADLLKVSHHGSGHSSTLPFLQAVRPRYALISAGSGNPFGHPHRGALARLEGVGAEVWRTDRHGTVTLRTDGFRLRLSGSRGGPADDRYRPLSLLGRRLFRAW